MKVILGSLSPRRRELIGKVIRVDETIASKADEHCGESRPELAVKEVALQKMGYFCGKEYDDALIITADTIVYFGGRILGKPHSREEAEVMLGGLSGNTHTVYTGVCLKRSDEVRTFVETSEVTFRVLSEKEISDYIDTGSPFDKAGGYGVQDSGFVERIDGSYDNVMGLPTERLGSELKTFLEESESE